MQINKLCLKLSLIEKLFFNGFGIAKGTPFLPFFDTKFFHFFEIAK
jgi:hypothetical protein